MKPLYKSLFLIGTLLMIWGGVRTGTYLRGSQEVTRQQAKLLELYRSNADPVHIAKAEKRLAEYKGVTLTPESPWIGLAFLGGGLLLNTAASAVRQRAGQTE